MVRQAFGRKIGESVECGQQGFIILAGEPAPNADAPAVRPYRNNLVGNDFWRGVCPSHQIPPSSKKGSLARIHSEDCFNTSPLPLCFSASFVPSS